MSRCAPCHSTPRAGCNGEGDGVAGRFEFALATAADDDGLRALLRQIAMPGDITLAFLREPSFFLAEQAGSAASQVLVCHNRQQGRIVGMGTRSVRSVYMDGGPTRVGYLGMLRGIPQERGNIGLARGYQFLKRLHEDGMVPYYFTAILDENADAVKLLTSGRAGLPVYRPCARLTTYLIPLSCRQRNPKLSDAVSRGTRDLLDEAVAYLQWWNSHYQFAPVYSLQDILGESELLPGFSWENLYIYREQGAVRGTLGVWDQSSFKQTVVTAYSPRMQAVRPLFNLYAAVRRIPRLPRAGDAIKLLYGTCSSGDGPAFARLVQQVCTEWSGRGYDYLTVGFNAESECAAIASRLATQRIKSTLYAVYWPDHAVVLPKEERPIHTEVATL